jgi:maltose alpha-D-glucosyltransferase / alpha-amylase
VHELVPNEGNAFTRSVDELGRRYEWAIGTDEELPPVGIDVSTAALLEAAVAADGLDGADEIHPKSELIGVRLGELHRAPALDRGNSAFTPEPFTKLTQRALYQSLRNRVQHGLQQLDRSIGALGPDARWWAEVVLADRAAVLEVVGRVNRRPLTARRIRVHGDLRLDQILWTGRDVVFLDFEGEPFRAIGERRLKRSAYLDLAGMLRSFEHATWVARHDLVERGIVTPGPDDAIEAVQQAWYWGVGASFLRGYRRATAGAPFVADDDTETVALIDAFCLDRAMAELTAGLHTTSEAAVSVPLAAMARLAGIVVPS